MRKFYLITIIFVLYGCGDGNNYKKKNIKDLTQASLSSKSEKKIWKEGFQKIDYSDKFYSRSLKYTTNDTLTKSGFKIEYFVLDSTKYEDLYIVWGNKQFTDTFEYKQVLAMEDYEYIPNLVEETNNFLILDYDCAQMECAARLYLSKHKGQGFRDFQGVLAELSNSEILVYNNTMFTSPSDTFYVYNMTLDTEYNIVFDKEVIFQSAQIKGNKLTIIASKDELSNEKYTQSIKLK